MINFFRIGKIITLHGIKGEVKVFSTTDDKKRFDVLPNVFLTKDEDYEEGTFDYTLEITGVKYVGQSPILKFKGFDTIEDSTKLIGYSLYVDREHAVKLKENEYYLPDLIGLICYVGNEKIGEVKDVMSTKANGILSVLYGDKEVLVPFVYDFIEKVDIEKKEIHLKTLEGLL